MKGAFACSGQWCTSTSRVIVLEETAAELTERLVAAARAIVVRDGANEDCGMGPVCGAKQKADILEYVAKGRAEGARLLTGGNALTGEDYDHGCFVAPTIFDHVTPSMVDRARGDLRARARRHDGAQLRGGRRGRERRRVRTVVVDLHERPASKR